jgi:MOSC domain-containing protein YiiM
MGIGNMWRGKLLNIHIAPKARAPMQPLDDALLIEGEGIEGDRYATGLGTYSEFPDVRDVTLIEVETLIALRRDHNIDLGPDEHRRNLTAEGVPLNHLVGKKFWVGPVQLEGGRLNVPCRYLDLVTGKPVYEILLHRSGLNCRILQGGNIRPGDPIRPD